MSDNIIPDNMRPSNNLDYDEGSDSKKNKKKSGKKPKKDKKDKDNQNRDTSPKQPLSDHSVGGSDLSQLDQPTAEDRKDVDILIGKIQELTDSTKRGELFRKMVNDIVKKGT